MPSVTELMNKNQYEHKAIEISNISSGPFTTIRSLETGFIVMMPVPTNLGSTTTQQWDIEDVGLIGQTATNGVDDIKNDGVASAAVSALKYSKNAMSKNLIGRQAEKNSGIVNNPGAEVFYGGPGFRSFQLDFELCPNTSAESIQIRDTIHELQKLMSPIAQGSTTKQYLYPEAWEIYIDGPQNEIEFMPKFQDSYLSNVTTNYSDTGRVIMMSDGAPYKIKLSLSFTESEVYTREKAQIFRG